MSPPQDRPGGSAALCGPLAFVIDTNIVLDLWVFNDPLVQPLHLLLGLTALADPAQGAGLESGSVAHAGARWLSTLAMREELARVLAYPHLVRRQALDERVAAQVLAAYDCAVTLCPVAPKARFTCTDGDDQKFIDLAVAHASPAPLHGGPAPVLPASVALLSKDKAVLRLKKRLASLGVWVGPRWSTA